MTLVTGVDTRSQTSERSEFHLLWGHSHYPLQFLQLERGMGQQVLDLVKMAQRLPTGGILVLMKLPTLTVPPNNSLFDLTRVLGP